MTSMLEEVLTSDGENKPECLGLVYPEQSERLDGLLNNAYSIRLPNPSNYHLRSELVRIFNAMAKEIFGNSTDFLDVKEFGSYLMDMFSADSDLDLSVNFSQGTVDFPREKRKQVLRKFGKKLFSLQARGHVLGVQTIFTARVPILKVTDRGSGVECDISVENRDGIIKSEIIRMVSFIDERFKKLASLMKAWAKTHKINSSKDRTLNSLSIISLVAFHLQTRSPPILPPFSALLGDGADAASVSKVVEKFLNYGKDNKESLAELFVSLFALLVSVKALWTKGLCVSTYNGSWSYKGSTCISIEDFCERSENIARAVGVAGVKTIYDCINSSLCDITAFKDGRMDGPKLMESLFGKESEIGKSAPPVSTQTKRKMIRAPPNPSHPRMNKKRKFPEGSSSAPCFLNLATPIVKDPRNGNGAKTPRNGESTPTHLPVPPEFTQTLSETKNWTSPNSSQAGMKWKTEFTEDSSSSPCLPNLASATPIVGIAPKGSAAKTPKNKEITPTPLRVPPDFTEILTDSKNWASPDSSQMSKRKTEFTEDSSSMPCFPNLATPIAEDHRNRNAAKTPNNKESANAHLPVPLDSSQSKMMWKSEFKEDSSSTPCFPNFATPIVGNPRNGNAAKTLQNDEIIPTHLPVPHVLTQTFQESKNAASLESSQFQMMWKTKFTQDSSSAPCVANFAAPILGDHQNGNASKTLKKDGTATTRFPVPFNFTQTPTETQNWAPPNPPRAQTKWAKMFAGNSSSLEVNMPFIQSSKFSQQIPTHTQLAMPNQLGYGLPPPPPPFLPQVLGFSEPQFYQNPEGQWSFQMPNHLQTSMDQNPSHRPWSY